MLLEQTVLPASVEVIIESNEGKTQKKLSDA